MSRHKAHSLDPKRTFDAKATRRGSRPGSGDGSVAEFRENGGADTAIPAVRAVSRSIFSLPYYPSNPGTLSPKARSREVA